LRSVAQQIHKGHSTTELWAEFIATNELQAIYSHCYRHALNVGVGDTIKQYQMLKFFLAAAATDILKFIKQSPKRDANFQKLKCDVASDQ